MKTWAVFYQRQRRPGCFSPEHLFHLCVKWTEKLPSDAHHTPALSLPGPSLIHPSSCPGGASAGEAASAAFWGSYKQSCESSAHNQLQSSVLHPGGICWHSGSAGLAWGPHVWSPSENFQWTEREPGCATPYPYKFNIDKRLETRKLRTKARWTQVHRSKFKFVSSDSRSTSS